MADVTGRGNRRPIDWGMIRLKSSGKRGAASETISSTRVTA